VTGDPRPPALLVLEDGTAFRGRAFGADGEAFGEAVFNTGMAGYQEVLTDPSYLGQIVTMTAPHVGNYGVNLEDPESDRVRVSGFVVREASRLASNWRSRAPLPSYLQDAGVVAVDEVDTRRLTLRLRDAGAMRSGISTVDLDPDSLVDRVRRQRGMEGSDLAAQASVPEPYEARSVVGPAATHLGRTFRIAAYDFGMKRNILRQLAQNGCETTVFPAQTPAESVLAQGYDGIFLSNGPGDPAVTAYGIDAAAAFLRTGIPTFGICLGHQLMALALGGSTYKLNFGHRGANQPVKDLETGRVEMTTHNHGFAVDPDGWGPPGRTGSVPVVGSTHGPLALTHWNLNDGTLEGLRCLDGPAFSVQYHPEAAPGPHDSGHLFLRFRSSMEGTR
jgi:carbamoyl-phosphate synthase small subunit